MIEIWKAYGIVLQELRAALLRLVTHVVVANSALVPLCLRVLTMGLQPPPAPPQLAQPGTSPALQPDWEPSPEVLAVQGEVIEALQKVTSRDCLACIGPFPFPQLSTLRQMSSCRKCSYCLHVQQQGWVSTVGDQLPGLPIRLYIDVISCLFMCLCWSLCYAMHGPAARLCV